jgi:hypothetical protein
MKKKMNCWEAKKCGREHGGAKCLESGVCPAAIESKLDGTHGGSNAGRACWVVAGTMCVGDVQGTFAKKYEHCEKCDYFHQVIKEEDKLYLYSPVLLKKLREG